MTGYPEAIGLLVELLHHPEGKIDVDTLLLKSLTARSGDIKHLGNAMRVATLKVRIEELGVLRSFSRP